MNSCRIIKTTFLVLATVLAANGFIIDCQYSTLTVFTAVNNAYVCQAMPTEDGNPDITAVTGTHQAGKSELDVTMFIMGPGQYLRVFKLPSNLATHFPNLKGIIWQSSRLETIKAVDLKPFPNLVLVDFSWNMIHQIDGDVFKNNPKLIVISFNGNHIENIGKGLFNGLSQLQDFNFYGNPCMGIGQNMMTIGPNYSIADCQADVEHCCSPLQSSDSGACSANCTARFDILEGKVSAIESQTTAPWYEKLRLFFRTAFGLC